MGTCLAWPRFDAGAEPRARMRRRRLGTRGRGRVFAQCDMKAEALRRKNPVIAAAAQNLRQLIMARAKAKGLLHDQTGE